MKFVAIGAVLVALTIGAGALWLADTRLMPAPQKVEQAIPDARIPH